MDTRAPERWHMPTILLQWGHALSGMDTKPTHYGLGRLVGFNGAMPFQAWISIRVVLPFPRAIVLQWGHAFSGMDTGVANLALASEEMLQWGHALSGMDTGVARVGQTCCPVGFNGAMPFQAWIQL